ncbi:cyclin-like protein [Phycomyces nitens]|nr:cyclin-like protein [Phycomyces nitens]
MNQWLFTREELMQVPSIVNDGMSVADELRKREFGSELIQNIGCRIELPQITVATACVYFHRFYARESFRTYDATNMAATCVYLACKVEESSRKLGDVVTALMHGRFNQTKHAEEKTKYQVQCRDTILSNETTLLEILCFDLTVDNPHQLMIELAEEIRAPDNAVQAGWTFANDSLRRPICLLYDPQMIAAACLLMGYHITDEDFPVDKDTIWGQILHQDPEILHEIIETLARPSNERTL